MACNHFSLSLFPPFSLHAQLHRVSVQALCVVHHLRVSRGDVVEVGYVDEQQCDSNANLVLGCIDTASRFFPLDINCT